MRALLLPLGNVWYAVEMVAAREVLEAPSISPLVTAPPTVLGVVNLRGDVVPVFDTGRLLGVGSRHGAAFVVVVVVDVDRRAAGLAVTATPETALLGEHREPSELPGTRGSFAVAQVRSSSAAARLKVVALIDLAALLAADRVAG